MKKKASPLKFIYFIILNFLLRLIYSHSNSYPLLINNVNILRMYQDYLNYEPLFYISFCSLLILLINYQSFMNKTSCLHRSV